MSNKRINKFNGQLPETARIKLTKSENGRKYMFVRGDGVKSKVFASIQDANQAFVENKIQWRGES